MSTIRENINLTFERSRNTFFVIVTEEFLAAFLAAGLVAFLAAASLALLSGFLQRNVSATPASSLSASTADRGSKTKLRVGCR
jgi:hypothetical protein